MPHIRTATLADAGRIAAIYNQCVGKHTLDTVLRTEEDFRETMQSLDDRERLLVIETGGEVAGYGILKKYSWKEGYRFAGETSVFLDEKYRGQGLGNHLKKELIEVAKALNYKHLVARILARNKVSIHYNLKLGYEMVGIQKQIGFTEGEWVDVAILQLVFG
jgi:L-amino acid N-acyltransferase